VWYGSATVIAAAEGGAAFVFSVASGKVQHADFSICCGLRHTHCECAGCMASCLHQETMIAVGAWQRSPSMCLQVVDKLKAHPGSNVRAMATDVQSNRVFTGSFDKTVKAFSA